MTVEEIKQMNIFEKLSYITAEIGVVEKNLKVQVNQNSSYKAVSERDVLDAVKPIEAKYRVYSYPVSRQIVDRDILVKENEYQGKITRTNTLFLRLETVYRFVNIDKPTEFTETTVYGDGLDTGDKATGKAMTYSDKYALMKAYKLSTGDDPDKDPSPENGYEQRDEQKATTKQISMLEDLYSYEEMDKILAKANLKGMQELTISQASALITRKVGKK